MLTAIIAACSVVVTQHTSSTPGALVSKMLARYSNARTLSGEVLYTQSAAGTSLRGRAEVQYERPSKLYVRQILEDPKAVPGRIVSNGVRFLYSLPSGLAQGNMAADPRQELIEPVQQQGQALDITQIYGVGVAGLSPRPLPVDLAIGRPEDLKAFKAQIATLVDQGTETVDGKAVRLMGGDWRAYAGAPSSGSYQLAITEAGDLVRYMQKEFVADPRPNMPPFEVTTAWVVRFTVNGDVDPKRFEDKSIAVRPTGSKP